jgi:hypothetical protein
VALVALAMTVSATTAQGQQEPEQTPAPDPPPPVQTPAFVPATGNARLDALVARVRSWFYEEREGFFLWAGGIMAGGWVAGGGGYRRTLARGIKVDGKAGISLRNYKLLDAGIHVPVMADRLSVDVRTRLMDAPRVNFYGVGNDTTEPRLTHFDYEPKQVDARLRFRPTDQAEVGASVGLLHVGTGPSPTDPSIETVFPVAEAPGLGQSVSYRTFGLYAQADRRAARDFTRRGGWYRVDWRAFADGEGRDWAHQRLDLDLRQFIPVGGERHAVLTRGVYSGTRAPDGDEVPHFMMPTLGDGEHLRGFANQRFADRHRVLVQGEYRYRLNERVHLAGFADLGQVAPRLGDVSLGDLHAGYGIGARVQTTEGAGLRADIARSREQWSFIVSAIVF